MNKPLCFTGGAILLLCVHISSFAQQQPKKLNTSITREVTSTANKKHYRLDISLPLDYNDNTKHYPLLIVLDGYLSFPLIATSRSILDLNGSLEPMIIVGISDVNDIEVDKQSISRWQDLTPWLDTVADTKQRKTLKPELVAQLKSGGAPLFLKAIKNDIIPYIEKNYRITDDRGLCGHSLAGLFTAWCLFTEPGLFNRYAIRSPSVWWYQNYLLQYIAKSNPSTNIAGKKILLTTGGKEGERMLTGYNALLDIFHKNAGTNTVINDAIFEGETHLSGIPVSLSRTLTALYSKK